MVFIYGLLAFIIALGCDADFSIALIIGCITSFITYVIRANRASAKEIEERKTKQSTRATGISQDQLQTILNRLAVLEQEVHRLKNQLSVSETDSALSPQQQTDSLETPAYVPSQTHEYQTSVSQGIEWDLPLPDRETANLTEQEQFTQPATVAIPATTESTGIAASIPSQTKADSGIDFSTPATPVTPIQKTAVPDLFEKAKSWLFGGNTLVRMGVLVLFVGVSLLVKFAADYGLMPIEVRLAGIAAGAIAMLGVGWRLRQKRPGYALIMQGGGVGLLYLNIFAAFRLYHLLPQLMVFGLLVTICVLAAFLSIRQNARSLAVMGSLGGFLAPVLISTGSGNHVALFSYYALLNAGIFGIAWFKAWRPLNMLGFFTTLIVASLWGWRSYTPDKLWSTEPFLILFLLFYSGIALCYAIRRRLELKNYLDSILVFGTPLAFCALQTGLMHKIDFAMAWSAIALGGYYLLIATWLKRYRKETLQMVFESSLGLGILFATLAIPFATLNERITAAAWAIEGAALLWAGLRLNRRLLRYSGLILQLIAGAVLLSNHLLTDSNTNTLFDGGYLSALMMAAAGIYSAWRLQAEKEPSEDDLPGLSMLAGIWGLFWWLGGNTSQILNHIMLDAGRLTGFLLLALSTAIIAHLLQSLLRWRQAGWIALTLPTSMLALSVLVILLDNPMQLSGMILWPFAMICGYLLLYRAQGQYAEKTLAWHHTLLCLALAAIGYCLLKEPFAFSDPAWQDRRIWAGAGATGIILTLILCQQPRWPIQHYRQPYLVQVALPLWLVFNLITLNALVTGYSTILTWLLWLLSCLFSYGLLYRLDSLLTRTILSKLHIISGYLLILLSSLLLNRLFESWDLSHTWYWSAWAYIGGMLLILLGRCPLNWPMQAFSTAYRLWIGAPVAILLGLWSFLMLTNNGSPSPLPYIPLLNPLDIAQILVGYALFDWLRAPAIRQWLSDRPWPAYALGACVLLWLNAVLLRTLHHWGNIPYHVDTLFASMTVQMSLSLFWSMQALAFMLWAVHKGIRLLWLTGAALLGLTVLKLFVVDLASIGSVERIISFIGVGLLLLLIGYFAPLPPHKKDDQA